MPFTIQCCCLSALICSGTFSEDLLPLYKVEGAYLLRNDKKYISAKDLLKPNKSSLISPGCRSRSLHMSKALFTETSMQERKSAHHHYLVLRLILYDEIFWSMRSTTPIFWLWIFIIFGCLTSIFFLSFLQNCLMIVWGSFPAKVEITLTVLLSFHLTAAILDVVSGINQLHILIPRRYIYNIFIHICLIRQAIQCPYIVFKIIENAKLCQYLYSPIYHYYKMLITVIFTAKLRKYY